MGGAGYFAGSTTVKMYGLTFFNNTATDGGAIIFSTGSSFDINNCTFKSNVALIRASSIGAIVF